MRLSDFIFLLALVVFAPGAIFCLAGVAAWGVVFLALVLVWAGATMKAMGK